MAAKIKKGDKVVVLAGKNRGEEGEVLAVYPQDARVLVKGINIIAKHQKPSQTSRGGILRREAPIHISNVALIADGKPSRVGFKIEDGKKVRFAKKTGEVVNG